jgi:hypothetical protein
LDAFQRRKVGDIKGMFREWARVQASYHREMMQAWRGIRE